MELKPKQDDIQQLQLLKFHWQPHMENVIEIPTIDLFNLQWALILLVIIQVHFHHLSG